MSNRPGNATLSGSTLYACGIVQRSTPALPATLSRAARALSVPAAARVLARRAAPLRLEGRVGDDAVGYPALTALVKLAWTDGGGVELLLERATGATELALARGGERTPLSRAELEGDVVSLLGAALARMGPRAELATLATELARETHRHRVFSAAVDELIRAATLDEALSATLRGIKSGLELDRVVLLAYDAPRAAFTAGVSITDEEAPPLTQRARPLILPQSEDEIAAAARGEGPVFDRPGGPRSAALAKLGPASWFVLARLALRGHLHGLVFGDRRGGAPKPADEDVAAVERFTAVASGVWETWRLRREVEDLTRYDSVTGLWNRRELEARLAQERSRAQRTSSSLALLVVGIDDLHAGAQPEALLRAVGGILRSELRALDIAARFDEDHVAAALPGAGAFEAALVAKRIGLEAHRKGISLCMGAASYPDDCDHPDDLVGLAERHLRAAQAAGRGRANLSDSAESIVFADDDS